MSAATVYAKPRVITDLAECWFYHTMDIPGYGTVQGEWDLRRSVDSYLGHVSFAGQRALDVGCASGFLSLHMERQGAEVVSYDLSDDYPWDIVPFAKTDYRKLIEERKSIIRKLNNSYWLNHRVHQSQARVVYGTVYAIPPEIGPVDICIFGSILVHLRDPFLALYNALRLTRSTVIVTEALPRGDHYKSLFGLLRRPAQRFVPNFRAGGPVDAWWLLTPEAIIQFLGVLGFEETVMTYHRQSYYGDQRLLFTVVGRRTAGKPEV
jgi:SAM-dependent methyltransferase